MKFIRMIFERMCRFSRKKNIDNRDSEIESVVKNSISLEEAFKQWKKENGS